MADRLVERVLLTGAVAGDRQIGDGLVLVVGRQPVMRQQPRDLLLSAFVPRLQPGGRLAVQAVAVDGDQRAVRGLLDQRVLEPVLGLGPAPALADQIQPHQVQQRLPNGTLLPVHHRLQEGQTELPPEHGRGHQRVSCAGVEPVDPRQDDLLDRGRDLERDVVDEAPAVLVVRHRAGVHERPDQLLQEERIALGGLEDAALHVGGERALAHERVEQLASGIARQRLQRHVGDPVRELAGRVLLRSPPRVIALQAGGQHQEERGALRVAEQPLEQLERRGIRPVEILQHDGQRPRLGESRDDLSDDLERPVLQRLRRELGQALRGVRLEGQAEERREVRGESRPPGLRTAARPSAGARRGRGAPVRRRGPRSSCAAGRGRASTAWSRRRTRIDPPATAHGRVAAFRPRTGRAARPPTASCRSRAPPSRTGCRRCRRALPRPPDAPRRAPARGRSGAPRRPPTPASPRAHRSRRARRVPRPARTSP